MCYTCRNVVSYSDGLPGQGRGIPYFYLTTLDPTARDALKDERSSFTLSEFPLGTCGKIDPENPTCAKLTLTGKVHYQTTHHSIVELFVISKCSFLNFFADERNSKSSFNLGSVSDDFSLCKLLVNYVCIFLFLD